MGRMHYYHNDRQEALRCFRSMLAEAQEVVDEELIAIYSSMIGHILVFQGYFDQARPLLVQAIAALERAANWTEYIDTICYLGIVRAGCGEYKVGVEAVQQALETHHLTADAFCYCYLAVMHILGGEMQRALEECRAIVSGGGHMAARLQAFGAGTSLLEVARTHQEWALLCRDHGNLTQALLHLEQAAATFEACGLLEERERACNVIAGLEQLARSAD